MRKFLWFALGFITGFIFAAIVAFFLEFDFEEDDDLEMAMQRDRPLIAAEFALQFS